MTTQEQNFEFFQSQLNRMLADPLYIGKFVVIHECQIKNVSDTFEAALKFALDNLPGGEPVIQQVIRPESLVSYLSKAL